MERRTFIAGAAVFLVLAAHTPPVRAGEYHVYTCRTPDGEVAPADGWVGSTAPGGAYDDYALNTCETGGALVAALGDETTHLAGVDRASWVFHVPGYARLTRAEISRSGDTASGGDGNATYQFWMSSPKLSSVFDECISSLGCVGQGNAIAPASEVNLVDVPESLLGSELQASAGCGGAAEPERYECPAGQGDANNYAAAIYLYAADLTLEQAAGPSASDVGGELASAPTLAGTSDLTFDATDPGSGVYEAVFTVDGSVVQSTVLDEDGGRCRDVGQTTDGLPAFLYMQPCPSSLSADVGFDSTLVDNGTHHLIVTVIDAAGNPATVLDRMIDVQNPGAPGPPNGENASASAILSARWLSTRRTRLTTAFGRHETIVGRLTGPTGVPIIGAQVVVSAIPTVAGGKSSVPTNVQTDATGAFIVRLAPGLSSRSVRLAYSARIGEPHAAASRTLQLAVQAPVWLTIAPRIAAAGTTIHFTGRLGAGPIPPGGTPLILEARSEGGAWIEFDVLRSDSHGRFRASYRFRFPGPVDYQFRVLCEQEADYPYATGSSRSINVWER